VLEIGLAAVCAGALAWTLRAWIIEKKRGEKRN